MANDEWNNFKKFWEKQVPNSWTAKHFVLKKREFVINSYK